MIEILEALLLVAGTIAMFRLQKFNRDKTLAWTFLFFAVSISLNIDALYLVVDGALGSRNFGTLASDLFLVVGTGFLAGGVVRSLGVRSARAHAPLAVGTVLAGTALVIAFTRINTHTSSTHFMLDYGNQLPAAVYSMVEYTFIALTLAFTGIVCVRRMDEAQTGEDRFGLVLMVIGCALAPFLAASVVVMDVAHLQGKSGELRWVSHFYDALQPSAIACVAVGMLLIVLGQRLADRRRQKSVTVAIQELHGLHRRVGRKNHYPASEVAEVRLRRMVVEIHDGLRQKQAELSLPEERALEVAEDALRS